MGTENWILRIQVGPHQWTAHNSSQSTTEIITSFNGNIDRTEFAEHAISMSVNRRHCAVVKYARRKERRSPNNNNNNTLPHIG